MLRDPKDLQVETGPWKTKTWHNQVRSFSGAYRYIIFKDWESMKTEKEETHKYSPK